MRVNGRLCQANLGGLGPVDQFLPIVDMPSGVQFSFFGSFEVGTDAFPLSAIPLQNIVGKIEAGDYITRAVAGLRLRGDRESTPDHGSVQADGKLVVKGPNWHATADGKGRRFPAVRGRSVPRFSGRANHQDPVTSPS